MQRLSTVHLDSDPKHSLLGKLLDPQVGAGSMMKQLLKHAADRLPFLMHQLEKVCSLPMALGKR